MRFPSLTDYQLIEAYQNALDLQLEKKFISILKKEMKKRKITEDIFNLNRNPYQVNVLNQKQVIS
ncbi:hypothetical protein HNQ94_000366 [Salirhabdus euzebyi]|uniref:Sporulation histidine kinase inhibitor Sda n=1 Tax=Salirhabdus euzebyi TaxID=394506 RepID=A0A841Q1V9_9BACI|nr:sporulation histidine kinase inhibitor Sda [Salirhabdus euzebyi]MBB6451945.1 hypothetical protein [Salirhabdus euzebyi]